MEFANNARYFLTICLLIVPAFCFSITSDKIELEQKLKALIHQRLARDVKEDCITPLFEKMQSCCPVPLLIPQEPQQRCTDGSKRGLFHTIREAVLSPFRRSRMGDMDFETQAQQFIGGPKCFIECSFKEMKLMMEEGKVDLNKTESYFLENIKTKKLYSPWIPIVKQVLSECSSDIENIPISTISAPHGKTCSTHPGVFMECVRRSLILNCPENQFSLSTGCIEGRGELVKCNPVEVLKAVTKSSQ